MMQCQGVARRALLSIRRDDGHFAERLRRLDQAFDAVCEDAVVVGDEKAQPVIRRADGSSVRGEKVDELLELRLE